MAVKHYEAPAFNRKEALRYAGVKESSPQMEALLDECITLAEGCWQYRVCWEEYPVIQTGNELDLGFAKITSDALMVNLRDCDRIVLFAATVGFGIDRLISRYRTVSPSRAHMLQALGAERVESLCDAFEAEIHRTLGSTRPRFSPGFGDVPLTLQKDVFRALHCTKHIGITLGESLLMAPSKSVTAIIGIRRNT